MAFQWRQRTMSSQSLVNHPALNVITTVCPSAIDTPTMLQQFLGLSHHMQKTESSNMQKTEATSRPDSLDFAEGLCSGLTVANATERHIGIDRPKGSQKNT